MEALLPSWTWGRPTRISLSNPPAHGLINKGWVPGPRMQVAGPTAQPKGMRPYPLPSVVAPFGLGPGAPSWQDASNINSPWLARAAVRERAHYGSTD